MNKRKVENDIQVLAGQVGQRANPSLAGRAPVMGEHQQLLVDDDQMVNQGLLLIEGVLKEAIISEMLAFITTPWLHTAMFMIASPQAAVKSR